MAYAAARSSVARACPAAPSLLEALADSPVLRLLPAADAAQRFFPLPPSHSLPLHLHPSSAASHAESSPDRLCSSLRLLKTWEALARRYTQVAPEDDDEWDLRSGACVRFGGLLDMEVGGGDGAALEFGALRGVKQEDEEEGGESDDDGGAASRATPATSSSSSFSSPPPPPPSSSSGDESDDSDDGLASWAPEQFGPVALHVRPRLAWALPSSRAGMKVEDLADLDAFLLADGLRARVPTPEPPVKREGGEGALDSAGEDDEDNDGGNGDADSESDDEIDFISETFAPAAAAARATAAGASAGPASAAAAAAPVVVKSEWRTGTMPASTALLPRLPPADRPLARVKREWSRAPSVGPPAPLSSASPAAAAGVRPNADTGPSTRSPAAPSAAASSSSSSSSPGPPPWTSSPLARHASAGPSRAHPPPSSTTADDGPPVKRPRLSTDAPPASSSPLGAYRPLAPSTLARPALHPLAPPTGSRIPVLASLWRTRARTLGPTTNPPPALAATAVVRPPSVKREPSPLPARPPPQAKRPRPTPPPSVKTEPHALADLPAPAKRPRGRPRQHAVDAHAAASHAVKLELVQHAADGGVPAKRPRGRPRKHPLPDAPSPAPAPAPAAAPTAAAAPDNDDDDGRAAAGRLALARALFPPAEDDDDEADGSAADARAKRALAAELFGDDDDDDGSEADDGGVRARGGRGRSTKAGVVVLDDDDDDPLAGYDVW